MIGGGTTEGGKIDDINFICSCGGRYTPDGMDGELIVFRCNKCHSGPQLECPICHKPRTIWTVYKKSCGFCGGRYTALAEGLKVLIGFSIMEQIKELVRRMFKAEINRPKSLN